MTIKYNRVYRCPGALPPGFRIDYAGRMNVAYGGEEYVYSGGDKEPLLEWAEVHLAHCYEGLICYLRERADDEIALQ